MATLGQTKVTLRRSLLARRRALEAAEVRAAGEAVSERLLGAPFFESSQIIGLYAGVRGEVPLDALIARVGERTLAFPRVEETGRVLSFWALEPGTSLERGVLGIPTPPTSGSRRIDLASLDLILIPGVAFDREGYRLGHGGGYYDATLPETPALRVGVAHSWQVMAPLPREAHDTPVHYLVTPEAVLRVPEKAAK